MYALVQAFVLDQEAGLDAVEEVAAHPVSAGQIDLLFAVVVEVEHALVFEKAPDDGAYADMVGNAGDTRPQRADAADDEINLDTGLRGFV